MYDEVLELIIGTEHSQRIMRKIDPDIDEYKFIEKLVENKVFKVIDWSGEFDDDEIADFVVEKVETFNDKIIKIDKTKIYRKIENRIQKEALERGDAPIIIFCEIDAQLKKIGFQLLFFDDGSDEYTFTVVCKNNYKKLIKNKKINFEKCPKVEGIFFVVCKKCGKKYPPEHYNGIEYIDCDCGNTIDVLEEILK